MFAKCEYILPSSGYIVSILFQWGSFAAGSKDYSFPISFTKGVFAGAFSQSGEKASQGKITQGAKPTLSQFTTGAIGTDLVVYGAYWIWIGS